jgi:hypothetical protein
MEEAIFFTNPDTAAQYIAVLGVDKHISIPQVYSGMLSGISPEVAEQLIAMGDNQVAPKEQA